jgi:chromobox protein 1/chromobox protein 3
MSESEQDSDEYVVECIKGKRIIDNQLEYLVKWEGYKDEESTWEPIENLQNVLNLIEEFEKKEESGHTANKDYEILYDLGTLVPDRITTVKLIDNELMAIVHFLPGSDGVVPGVKYVPSKVLKATYPKKLIQFYESKIKFVKTK